MFLIVDRNEESTAPKVVALLKKYFTQVLIADLPHHKHGNTNVTSGDVNIPLSNGSVLAIERKTPEDFLQSIGSGHIFDQIEVMANNAKYSAFIITGSFSYTNKSDMVVIDDEVTNWKGASVRATMALIQYSGCALIFCPPNQYPNMIAELYNTVNKPSEHRHLKKNRIVTFPPVDGRVELMAQFPSVSLKSSDSVMKWAGMMDGNTDEDGYGRFASALHWISIMLQIDKNSRPEGWGPAKVLSVRKMLGLESNEYITILREDNDNEQE